ncbi:MAG: hypothetical protein ING91_19270 [Rhodocyclaceae bacterium]|nr:hypothetical protein [Rhodocyclaceae bacterium]MCA3116375.1 hypothetical protein [Rhodocyclaceae bacterium]MCA3128566.1 hypothetical protein [Rhodocyclaceae bacterium]
MTRDEVICAVCRRPVEVFSVTNDPSLWARSFYARCHGKKDTLIFSDADAVPNPVIMFREEAEAIRVQREQAAAAPADYFVCLSMLVTGRHKHPDLMLGLTDVIALDIALEGNP